MHPDLSEGDGDGAFFISLHFYFPVNVFLITV